MNSIHWDLWLRLRKSFPCSSKFSIVPVHWHWLYTPLWVRIACRDTPRIPLMVERTLSFPLMGQCTPEFGLKPLSCFGTSHAREVRFLGRVLSAESAPVWPWLHHGTTQPSQSTRIDTTKPDCYLTYMTINPMAAQATEGELYGVSTGNSPQIPPP